MSDFSATTANTSATRLPADQQMWYYGGNQLGPAPATNPIRQWLGNLVEGIGDAIPGSKEGYLSEMIAGGPTKHTGQVKATDGITTGDNYDVPINPDWKPNTDTNPGPTNNTQPSGGGIPGVDMSFYQGWNDQNAINADWAKTWQQKLGAGGSGGGSDPYAGLRGEISSGYDSYISKLDEMMNRGLPGQASNMNQIINNQYDTGSNSLRNQESIGLSDLGTESTNINTNQAKNLKDLSENIRNMFMSGNVYLGSRGAGDSSAANQYSYALTKQGNKSRGDLMSQTAALQAEIGKRTTNLKQTIQTELQNLARERDSKVLEVSNWLGEQQNALREKIGQAGLSKSTDLANLSKTLLDNALAKLQQAEQDITSRKSMLEQWAVNQSTNIGQLKSNLAAVSSYNPSLPQAQQFSGTPTISGGNYSMPINWSTNNKEEEKSKSLFG